MTSKMQIDMIIGLLLLTPVAVVFWVQFIFIMRALRPLTRLWFLRHLRTPILLRRTKLSQPLTRLQALHYVLTLSAVALSNAVFIASREAAAKRAGVLSVASLPALFLTSQLSQLADFWGVSLTVARNIHGCLGLFCCVETLLHIALVARPLVFDTGNIAGLTSAVLLGILLSSPALKFVSHEFFFALHNIAGIVCWIGVWLHLHDSTYRLFAIIAAGTLLLTTFWRALRTYIYGKASVHINSKKGLILLHISLSHYIRVRPGQHFHITIPGLTLTSFLQRHPFMVIAGDGAFLADQEIDDSEVYHSTGLKLLVLIVPRKGWTSSLQLLTKPASRRILLDGPYGSPPNIAEFGLVVMFMSGTGLVALLPQIISLSTDIQHFTVTSRHVQLHVEVCTQDELELVSWLLERLALGAEQKRKEAEHSKRELVHITLYDNRSQTDALNLDFPYTKGPILASKTLAELQSSHGYLVGCRTLVCVSARTAIRDGVRRAISNVQFQTKKVDDGVQWQEIDLFEPDFQPD